MKVIIASIVLMVFWVSVVRTEGTTTKKPFVKLDCKFSNGTRVANGFFIDGKDPTVFHQCSHGQHIATFHCQPKTVFDEKDQVCVLSHKEEFKCPEPNGIFPFPGNIHKFIECYEGHAYVRTCAADLIFDDKKDECVYNDGNSPWPTDPTTEATKAPSTKAPL